MKKVVGAFASIFAVAAAAGLLTAANADAASIATSNQAAYDAFTAGAAGTVNFDDVTGVAGFPDTSVTGDAAITDRYRPQGLLFSSTGGPAGAVNGPSDASSDPNLLSGTRNDAGTVRLKFDEPINVNIVLPGTATTGGTNLIGAFLDPTGAITQLSVYDSLGNLLESVQGNQGEWVAIGRATPDISSAVFSYVSGQGYPGFTIDDVRFGPISPVSAVPVPAALPLMGSALAALGLLRRRKAA